MVFWVHRRLYPSATPTCRPVFWDIFTYPFYMLCSSVSSLSFLSSGYSSPSFIVVLFHHGSYPQFSIHLHMRLHDTTVHQSHISHFLRVSQRFSSSFVSFSFRFPNFYHVEGCYLPFIHQDPEAQAVCRLPRRSTACQAEPFSRPSARPGGGRGISSPQTHAQYDIMSPWKKAEGGLWMEG